MSERDEIRELRELLQEIVGTIPLGLPTSVGPHLDDILTRIEAKVGNPILRASLLGLSAIEEADRPFVERYWAWREKAVPA